MVKIKIFIVQKFRIRKYLERKIIETSQFTNHGFDTLSPESELVRRKAPKFFFVGNLGDELRKVIEYFINKAK